MSKQEDNLQNKFTYCELREIWPALKRYVDHTYTKHLSTSGRIDIMKRWIHFYSREDFTKEETTQEHSRSLNSKRMRRVALTGRFFEKPQPIRYLWTNWLYPIALVISLISLLLVGCVGFY